MNAEYKRDLQNNYLILELEQGQKDGYRLQMAEQNEIAGLLPFHSSGRDGRRYLHYEITSRQPLSSLYERKPMRYQDILSVLTDIQDTMEAMQKYLLDPSDLIFAPDYILVGADRRAAFCYFPEKCQETEIRLLAEFILKKLDHEEEAAVALGYRFYQKVCEENFSLSQIWRELICREQEFRTNPEQEAVRSEPIERPEITLSENLGKKRTSESYEEYEDEIEQELYQVVHKERRNKKTAKKLDWLFEKVHPLVLLSTLFFLAAIEILYYFQLIQLTEAGGMFFLMLSAEMLANRFWKKRKEKKKKRPAFEEYEDEDLGYEALQREMYRESDEEIGETCCLTTDTESAGIRLICMTGTAESGLYPDICLEEGVLYIGKRKGESDVILNSPAVSRMHARLEARNGQFFVKDLNSRNGTICNGARLHPQEEKEFSEGDQITFAQIRYRAVRM